MVFRVIIGFRRRRPSTLKCLLIAFCGGVHGFRDNFRIPTLYSWIIQRPINYTVSRITEGLSNSPLETGTLIIFAEYSVDWTDQGLTCEIFNNNVVQNEQIPSRNASLSQLEAVICCPWEFWKIENTPSEHLNFFFYGTAKVQPKGNGTAMTEHTLLTVTRNCGGLSNIFNIAREFGLFIFWYWQPLLVLAGPGSVAATAT